MMSALLLCRLQRFEDVRRLSHRADVPLNQKVDESRDHGGYFRVLLRVVRNSPSCAASLPNFRTASQIGISSVGSSKFSIRS